MRAAKLSRTSCSVSGNNTFAFGKPRKIPLLSDVFDAVKNDDLVMYLNVSWWNPPCFLLAVQSRKSTVRSETQRLLHHRRRCHLRHLPILIFKNRGESHWLLRRLCLGHVTSCMWFMLACSNVFLSNILSVVRGSCEFKWIRYRFVSNDNVLTISSSF